MLDSFGRNIDYLRFSVTDRCDLRCRYCMPEKTSFSQKKDMLDLNQLKRLADVLIKVGIKKIRITGGEPFVRKDIISFLEYLFYYKKKQLLNEITLTTNGTLLEKYAEKLKHNGIERLNVSIDSLIPEKYSFITNGGKIDNVLKGIDKAKKLGIRIKINVVLLKNFNEDEIISLINWSAKNGFNISFIEIMPLGEIKYSRNSQYIPVSVAKKIIENHYPLISCDYSTNGPSKYYKTKAFSSLIGFISPISNHFCESCNRIRITSNGILYSCLGHESATNLKISLEKNNIEEVERKIKNSIKKKPEKHFFDINEKDPAVKRFMSFTGG